MRLILDQIKINSIFIIMLYRFKYIYDIWSECIYHARTGKTIGMAVFLILVSIGVHSLKHFFSGSLVNNIVYIFNYLDLMNTSCIVILDTLKHHFLRIVHGNCHFLLQKINKRIWMNISCLQFWKDTNWTFDVFLLSTQYQN